MQADNTIAHIFAFMHRPLQPEVAYDAISPTTVPQILKLYQLLQPSQNVPWPYTKLSFLFASHEHLFYIYDPNGSLGQTGPYKRTDPSTTGPNYVVTGGAGAPLMTNVTSGSFFHYLVVNVNGNDVTVTVMKISDSSNNCPKS